MPTCSFFSAAFISTSIGSAFVASFPLMPTEAAALMAASVYLAWAARGGAVVAATAAPSMARRVPCIRSAAMGCTMSSASTGSIGCARLIKSRLFLARPSRDFGCESEAYL